MKTSKQVIAVTACFCLFCFFSMAHAENLVKEADSSNVVAQALKQYGLLGTWADDCSQPPSDNNFHTVYAALPNGNVQRTYYNAPDKIFNQYELKRVTRISSDQLYYQQEGSAGRIDVILKIDGNRYHVLSSQNENGKIYVQEGKFTSNTSAPGKESPWQTKCHD